MKKLILAVVLAGFAAASAHANAVATFTGMMEQVQTVSGQYAWKCQYDYFGRKFYRLFKSHCPGIIEVE